MIGMMITTPCTLYSRAGSIDTYGDLIDTETGTSALCEVQPVHEEEFEGGALAATRYNLYLLGSVDLKAVDAVEVASLRYELVGDATPRRDPLTRTILFTHALVVRTR